ncbi:MAG: M10 family metallopeptidase C-terminal domain-containing protein [Alteraurantiacibacter sp. bin_em_oilr2.035]|nr:M10 family metallopeptidase C-terminal domain-containing protein [Alteraurantiacibacter sp. bin_em_oilr2.035]
MTVMAADFLRGSFNREEGLVETLGFDSQFDTPERNSFHAGILSLSAVHAAGHGGHVHQPGGNVVAAVDNIPGGTSTTATVAPGSFATSEIDTSSDSDWFRINLTAGETYTFTVFLASLPDSILTLRDSAGTVIETNDDANTAAGLYYSEITFTATSTAAYYLDVTGWESSTGQYFLSSSMPLNDDVAGDASTSASLTIGAAATSSSLNLSGDRDWYAVTLEAGQIYEFSTSATGGANDVDTTLTLRNSSGDVVAYNDDSSGTYSRIRYVSETNETFYIDVGGWADSQQGNYQLAGIIAPALQEFTNDEIADQLINGYWGGSGASRRFNVEPGDTLDINVTALTGTGQYLAREALNLWSDVLGISFNKVTSGGQIIFDDAQDGAFASSTTVNGFISQSNVNISTDWLVSAGTTLNSYSFQTYLHEIGHALGLGHAGNYNSTASYSQDAVYLNDAWASTIMSYFDQNENTFFNDLDFSRVFAISPMSADVVAIQNLYGVTATTRTGGNTYGAGNNTGRDIYGIGPSSMSSMGTLLAFTIVDHGGNDTLDYSPFSAAQYINLNAETFSNVGGSIGNMSIARGTVIENAIGGFGNDQLVGNDVVNFLTGGSGFDVIDGGSNIDTAIFSGNSSSYAVTQTSAGVFQVSGPDGTDTLTAIEYLQFDDETIRLLPGSGVSVNFDTADPAVYQMAMNNIRDFDGNALGGNGAWLRIGEVDVNGDGDIDQILVNNALGRFATVGTADDGLVYFDDYGWAGETRVAGTYIDPLVASGEVVAGSPHDSQTRFQNDLEIENIIRVLDADDYDGDDLQEIYFALTDGSAYLHAYMHADGNIQYANYQSEQQVIDYLTANGYDASTYADWFPADQNVQMQPDDFALAQQSAKPAAFDLDALGLLPAAFDDGVMTASLHDQMVETFA